MFCIFILFFDFHCCYEINFSIFYDDDEEGGGWGLVS